ncbi:MAG: hypothetical protein HZA91_01795 [Verrucomicrobia bacterium]|nr:hypothetical protein [Verrucomicrobiota bacterium]
MKRHRIAIVTRRGRSPVAFRIDEPGATVAVEQNPVEGRNGVGEPGVVEIKRTQDSRK